MINIKPKTYNEILRLARCMKLKGYITEMTDEQVEEMYYFLNENPKNQISVTPEMISYVNASGATERATVLETAPSGGFSFDRIVLGAATFAVYNNRRPTSSSGGCTGCSSCSGCSSNNNNNNNNNNNG